MNRLKGLNYSMIALDFLVGAIFVLFNFNGFMRYAVKKWSHNPTLIDTVVQVSHWPEFVMPAQPQAAISLFGNIMNLCFLGLWLYLGAMILLSLARLKPSIVANGVLGLTTGISSIAIFGWIGVILAAVLGFLVTVGIFIANILSAVWLFLEPFVRWVCIALAWVCMALLIAALIAGIVWGAITLWRKWGFKGILGILAASGILYFTWSLLAYVYKNFILPILRWLASVLEYVIGLLAFVLGWLVKILIVVAIVLSAIGVVLGFVGSVGRMLNDQIRAAWNCGSGRRGILLGSFAVGFSLAVVLWVSASSPELSRTINSAWQSTAPVLRDLSPIQIFSAMQPASIVETSRTLFQTMNTPVFDGIILLGVLLISYVGILRGIRPQQEDKFHTSFISQDLLKLGGVLVLALPAVAVVLLIAMAPKDD